MFHAARKLKNGDFRPRWVTYNAINCILTFRREENLSIKAVIRGVFSRSYGCYGNYYVKKMITF